MPNRADRIRSTLATHFAPDAIEVEDQSHLHAGHGGARPEGETHYAVRLVSAAFAGMSRVARSRAVQAHLADEFAGGLHALSLNLRAPGEG